MRMSHVYQPVMLRLLLERNGRASVQDVARALLNEDRSQLEYYSEITKNMVGRVLANRAVVKREGGDYELLGYDRLTAEQVQELKARIWGGSFIGGWESRGDGSKLRGVNRGDFSAKRISLLRKL